MKINFECDKCQYFNQFQIKDKCEIECNNCKEKYGTIDLNWDYNNECIFCKKTHYYKRKNFNQLIGLFIIILGGGLALWFHSQYGPLSYIFLGIFSLLDFVLFKFTDYLGVCYSCSAEYYHVDGVDVLDNFEHHDLEMYQN
tara:strand:+ start:544 stop:966 length:423 start_codon:yes stop_codon:yes gene_type:complete